MRQYIYKVESIWGGFGVFKYHNGVRLKQMATHESQSIALEIASELNTAYSQGLRDGQTLDSFPTDAILDPLEESYNKFDELDRRREMHNGK